MEYSTLVLHATGIATFFLSPKHGDLQILFLVEGWNLCEHRVLVLTDSVSFGLWYDCNI